MSTLPGKCPVTSPDNVPVMDSRYPSPQAFTPSSLPPISDFDRRLSGPPDSYSYSAEYRQLQAWSHHDYQELSGHHDVPYDTGYDGSEARRLPPLPQEYFGYRTNR
ncbi:hypothetical protein CALCODRAFT_501093 [Calocera cornea HHB12733]|uniref:Uncharacterized protein n=1 Tax=Calocera cornea HHB12733 TaxID=1353952 RepID=A0A165DT61_9BASI|nr:hypothetical protein CALCODRAFT_501093 [Calocera cornea HHB12733]